MITVEAEISATAYKKLVARLKGLSKVALWKVLDHYVFHCLNDDNVTELLTILDQFEQKGTQSITAQAETLSSDLDGTPTVLRSGPRLQFGATLTDEDLDRSKAHLDLLYDPTYFTYLDARVRSDNAAKLITFAEHHKLPVQPHWRLIAGQDLDEGTA